MSKVSIIVPIYNTGEQLRRCIDSVLNQTLNDIEVILINDGSTDNSGNICDEYAKKDSRVVAVHKQNEGVSIARNTGIAMANGEYIGFVDSDDWIENDMYSDLYSIAKEHSTDIVMCDATTKYDDKPDEYDTIIQLNESVMLKKNNIYPKLLMEMAGAAWRCIYRRELILKNEITFKVGLKFSEDRIFNIYAMGYANGLYYVKKSYYNRYIRKGSAVNKYYKNMIDIVLDARKGTMEALDRAWEGKEIYKTAYEGNTVGFAFSAINNEFYKDSKGSFLERYSNVRKICNTYEVRVAIQKLNCRDIRAKLITHRQVLVLCVIAMYLNKKYKR